MTNDELYQAIVKELRRDDEERRDLEADYQGRCMKAVDDDE